MWQPPQRLVHESLARLRGRVPDKPAVVAEYGSTTCAELARRRLRFARLLQDSGLERGDRVALYLDNTRALRERDLRHASRGRRLHVRQSADEGRQARLHPRRQRGVVRGRERLTRSRRVAAEAVQRARHVDATTSSDAMPTTGAIASAPPEPRARGHDPERPRGPRLHLGDDRRAEGRDAQPRRARLLGREHRRVPAARRGRPDPERPPDGVHVRAQPAAAGRAARRDALARALVHVPGEDARAAPRGGGDRLPGRPDRLRHDSRHVEDDDVSRRCAV